MGCFNPAISSPYRLILWQSDVILFVDVCGCPLLILPSLSLTNCCKKFWLVCTRSFFWNTVMNRQKKHLHCIPVIGHNWFDPQVLIFKYPAKPTMTIDDDEFVPLLKEHSLADIARDTSYELKEAIAAPWIVDCQSLAVKSGTYFFWEDLLEGGPFRKELVIFFLLGGELGERMFLMMMMMMMKMKMNDDEWWCWKWLMTNVMMKVMMEMHCFSTNDADCA